MFNWFKRQIKSDASTVPASVASLGGTRHHIAAEQQLNTAVTALTDAGMTRYGEKNYAEAITIFRQILDIDPYYLVAHYQLANALLASRDFERAMTSCKYALGVLPNQPDLLLLSAAIANAADDHSTCLEILQHTKLTHPSLADVDLKISEVLCFLGRGQEAIRSLDDAIEQNPGELTRKSNRLFFLNFFGLLDRHSLFEEHRKWGAMIDAAWAPLRKPKSSGDTRILQRYENAN